MKPTPIPRSHWAAALGLAGVAVLLLPSGCGMTREIVHPPRRQQPARTIEGETTPDRPRRTLLKPRARPVEPPAVIDVPAIDRTDG